MYRNIGKIEVFRIRLAEQRSLVDASQADANALPAENMFDRLEREAAIRAHVKAVHGSLEHYDTALTAEFVGQKGRTAAEMIKHLRGHVAEK